MDDFLMWIESIGGFPAAVHDPYKEMRRAGVVLSAAVTA
jgi:hypothetical protein